MHLLRGVHWYTGTILHYLYGIHITETINGALLLHRHELFFMISTYIWGNIFWSKCRQYILKEAQQPFAHMLNKCSILKIILMHDMHHHKALMHHQNRVLHTMMCTFDHKLCFMVSIIHKSAVRFATFTSCNICIICGRRLRSII